MFVLVFVCVFIPAFLFTCRLTIFSTNTKSPSYILIIFFLWNLSSYPHLITEGNVGYWNSNEAVK